VYVAGWHGANKCKITTVFVSRHWNRQDSELLTNIPVQRIYYFKNLQKDFQDERSTLLWDLRILYLQFVIDVSGQPTNSRRLKSWKIIGLIYTMAEVWKPRIHVEATYPLWSFCLLFSGFYSNCNVTEQTSSLDKLTYTYI